MIEYRINLGGLSGLCGEQLYKVDGFEMRRAFTIVELLVAMGLFGMLLAASGIIFATAVKAHRTAEATAEIARNLAAITDQLNADFRGLRKEGVIFVAWIAAPVLDDIGDPIDNDGDGNPDKYERFDRLLFFADGDFQSYGQWPVYSPPFPYVQGDPISDADGAAYTADKILSGNLARICYMLARPTNDPGLSWPEHLTANDLESKDRILARSQHIFTAETVLETLLDPVMPPYIPSYFSDLANIPVPFTSSANVAYEDGNNWYEYETELLETWRDCPWQQKREMLTVCTDIQLPNGHAESGGVTVDTEGPENVHMLMAKGVGSFSVQGWYELQNRWFPEVDPDDDGDLDDSDFFTTGTPPQIDPCSVPLLVYPYGPYDSPSIPYPDWSQIDEAHFNEIPGLGRALKFTFTLYDSRGIFEEGKTFTHIVYLDD